MACKPKSKMSRAARAKQFAPFAALKGFEDALRKKEKVDVLKKELYDEKIEELNEKFKTISKGDNVNIVYYSDMEYKTISGILEVFDLNLKYLEINKIHITFDNVFEISKNM